MKQRIHKIYKLTPLPYHEDKGLFGARGMNGKTELQHPSDPQAHDQPESARIHEANDTSSCLQNMGATSKTSGEKGSMEEEQKPYLSISFDDTVVAQVPLDAPLCIPTKTILEVVSLLLDPEHNLSSQNGRDVHELTITQTGLSDNTERLIRILFLPANTAR